MVIVILRPTRGGKADSKIDLPHGGDADLQLMEATPGDGPYLLDETGAAGIYVLGEGAESCWSEGHRGIVARALEMDMPVLALGDGLLLLNEVFGGKSPEGTPASVTESGAGVEKPERRTVYVSPGSKTAAILGAGGFFRLGGAGAEPKLMDGQRAPSLLASAYDVEDGAVEGLESAEHGWVIGFRADLNADERLPRGFGGIFQAFVERAEGFHLAHAVP